LQIAERAGLARSVEKVRRQSGAARSLARHLLRPLGYDDPPILRSETGLPLWPPGIIGSLAHDAALAVAAIADARDLRSVGIDVEPAEPLPDGLVELVATPRERERYSPATLNSRLLFVLKEAIYKASFAIDQMFLDFSDVEVDLASRVGITRSGRKVHLAFTCYPRLVALAYLPH